MSREVKHDGKGAFHVRFPFDRRLVDRLKTLPSRRWNASERLWSVPESDVVLLVDLLRDDNFRFDEPTRKLYAALGGTADLDAGPAVATGRPLMAGLFDEPSNDESTTRSSNDDYTVSSLNEGVRRAIEAAFPSSIWVVGEISGFNKSAHRRIVGFHLVEIQNGERKAEVSATLFDNTRRELRDTLARAGDPFTLEDEITVRLLVRVELYIPWGSYRVIVDDIDVNYTLGEAARRREEIIRRLTEAGLLEQNSSLPMPAFPLRIGLITSLGSDAYNDVLRTLQESGFAFEVTAHGARVQGRRTEPSVLNALDWFRKRAERFDALLICRGGGSRTDLSWFDSEALGRAVANMPLPVVVGIGHEKDHSVLDAVGRRAKTPTAAGGLLVETLRQSIDALERQGRTVLEQAAQIVTREGQAEIDRERRLAAATRELLGEEKVRLAQRQQRAVLGARASLSVAREALVRWVTGIPRSASVHVAGRRHTLDNVTRSLFQSTGRSFHAAGKATEMLAAEIGPRFGRALAHEAERLAARGQRLRLVDPRRVLERGYTILRLQDGRVLSDAAKAPAGTTVQAELRRGSLALRSEGQFEGGDGADG